MYLSVYPSIVGSLVLCFDTDFDVSIITQRLGIEPTESKRLYETRINPTTKRHNCGYWRIMTKEFKTFDSMEIQKALQTLIAGKEDAINEIIAEYQGTVIFRFFIKAYPGDEPALMFSEDFVYIVNQLNAKLDVLVDIPFNVFMNWRWFIWKRTNRIKVKRE